MFMFSYLCTWDSNGLHLWQTKYVNDLFAWAQMCEAKPYRAPCITGSKLSKFHGEPLQDPSSYRHIVGAAQYVTHTRPDIVYFVNQFCQHMHTPTNAHWVAAKCVLHYLKGLLDCGLLYHKDDWTLTAFCVSDWVDNPDDRQSASGFGIFLGRKLISWFSKKQHTVSRFSTKVKYRALTCTIAELFWLQMLLQELQVLLRGPPMLWWDNAGAIQLAFNSMFHACTKTYWCGLPFYMWEGG